MEPLIIIPAFNEEKTIGNVIKELKNHGYKNIVVINDGSTDKTAKIAEKQGIKVVNHLLNRGLGAALKTGVEYAKKQNIEIVITFDSDGQHKASDIKKLIKPIVENKADFVIGTRLLLPKYVPFDRKIIIWLSNLITFCLYGVWTTDSVSGLRAFSKKALNLIEIKTEKMEVSNEFFREVKKHKLKYAEVPIQAIYTDYSREKGQKNTNAFSVGLKMLLRLSR